MCIWCDIKWQWLDELNPQRKEAGTKVNSNKSYQHFGCHYNKKNMKHLRKIIWQVKNTL